MRRFAVAACAACVFLTVTSETLNTEIGNDIDIDLFGEARVISKVDKATNTHPRVLFDEDEWTARVRALAQDALKPRTFSYNFMSRTWQSMRNSRLEQFRRPMNDSQIEEFATSNNGDPVSWESETLAFFVQAQRAQIYLEQVKSPDFQDCSGGDLTFHRCVANETAAETFMEGTKHLLYNWARFSLKTRELYGGHSHWSVYTAYQTGGGGYVLAVDIMYNSMGETERDVCLSFIASTVADVMEDPSSTTMWGFGRPITNIWSNWAGYNSHIYLYNCILEGTPFYNEVLNSEYVKILEGFMQNSIYESGFSFEDGYTSGTALREGSTALIALARREHNFLDTDRFRKFISYAAHSHEPWGCSNFIGHGSGSGGGRQYQSYLALIRYAYPNGSLPQMLWRSNVDDLLSCYWKGQSTVDIALFGDASAQNAASEPASVVGSRGSTMKLSIYGKERGLLIARSSLAETALYVHLNARPDAMLPGHDNADRGSFTLTANRRSWVPSLPWHANYEAHKHNMVFVDGAAQFDKKVPPAPMAHEPIDDGKHVVSSIDLTYATTYKWSPPWSRSSTNWNAIEPSEGWEQEMSDPRDLGFPTEEADALGMPTTLWGHEDFGFLGLYQWRALFNPVKYNIRSTVLVRDHNGESYYVVGDVLEKDDEGLHEFSWEMTLSEDTDSNFETIGESAILLSSSKSGEEDSKLAVHAATNTGDLLTFELAPILNGATCVGRRLKIRPAGRQSGPMRFTIVLHPFTVGSSSMLSVYGDVDGDVLIKVLDSTKTLSMDNGPAARMVIDQKNIEEPTPLSWKAMPRDGIDARPPPRVRFLLSNGVSRSALSVGAFSDASTFTFDPESAAEFPNGYEHVFLIFPYSNGGYSFSFCPEVDGSDSKLNIYRFTPELLGSSGHYNAYLERKMEKLYGLQTPTCSVQVDLEGPAVYIVQLASKYDSAQLALSVA